MVDNKRVRQLGDIRVTALDDGWGSPPITMHLPTFQPARPDASLLFDVDQPLEPETRKQTFERVIADGLGASPGPSEPVRHTGSCHRTVREAQPSTGSVMAPSAASNSYDGHGALKRRPPAADVATFSRRKVER